MKVLKIILVCSFIFLLFSLSFTTSSDFNQDLGRHLKLGEIITQTHQISSTNLFSYTTPHFPFINHHWLFELITYHLSSIFGINSLTFLKVLLMISSVGIVMLIGIKNERNGFKPFPTMISGLILAPLLLERNDIRPELFGYLYFAILLYFVFREERSMTVPYSEWIIPIIMVLWINTHITFVFGVLLISLLLFKFLYLKLYLKFQISNFKLFPLLITPLALLLNPHGLNGLLYPFRIFGNYGYTIVENQNLFFLNSMINNPLIKYFFLLSPLCIVTIFILLFNKKWTETFLFFIFYFLSFYQIRHLPFFVLTAIPCVSISITVVSQLLAKFIIDKLRVTRYVLYEISSITLSIICIILTFSFINSLYFRTFDQNKSFGLGFSEEGKNAAEFVIQNNLPQNIFNNFDIGGYAIYRLYPKYRVFVDNRPEAYPKEFLQQVYIPMQEDKKLRDEVFKKYDINTIFFAHTDQTPWAQTFVTQILADKNWRLIYYDSMMMVMVKDCQDCKERSVTVPYKDIRSNIDYTISLINSETNYIELIKLTNFIRLFAPSEYVLKALEKAYTLNPSSCTLKRTLASQYENSPQFDVAEKLKRGSWWCFK